MPLSGLHFRALLRCAIGLAALLALGGCATTRIIDSEVRSFAGSVGPANPASYRFERLPSQDLQAKAQDQLEIMAKPLLESVGLRKSDNAPQYALQMTATVQAIQNPSYGPYWRRQRWIDRDGLMLFPSMGLML